MPTSIFLAKLIGPIFVAVGAGVLVNWALYRKLAEEFLRSRALIYLSGLLTMTAGMAIVLSHNVWSLELWRDIITLLGWLAVIGGAVRIVIPQKTESIGRWFLARPLSFIVGAGVWLGIGAELCFFGYFW
jgi:hypothetical protein